MKDLLALPVETDGPFLVGYRKLSHTYTPKGQTTPRTILVHVWYPATEKNDASPIYGPLIDLDAYTDAPAMTPVRAEGFPVLVYSHGSNSFGGSAKFLLHRFVSNGWVYIAPDHTGNLLLDSTADKDRPIAMYYERSLDVSEALSFVKADATLGPRIASDRVVMAGHSYGGFTSWATAGAKFDAAAVKKQCDAMIFQAPCTQAEVDAFAAGVRDPRVIAAIPMAGGNGSTDWFGQTGQDSVEVPLLIMSGTEDPASAEEAFSRVSGVDLSWIHIDGACHQTFSLGGCKNIPDAESFAIVNAYSLAFARKHLLSDTSARTVGLTDGSMSASPRVTFKHKAK